MIRQYPFQATKADEADLEDPAMRFVEYAMALVALAVAGILALVR